MYVPDSRQKEFCSRSKAVAYTRCVLGGGTKVRECDKYYSYNKCKQGCIDDHEAVHVGQLTQWKLCDESIGLNYRCNFIEYRNADFEKAANDVSKPCFKKCDEQEKKKNEDHADESFSISDSNIPNTKYYSQIPHVSILMNGTSEYFSYLIGSFKRSNIFNDINFEPIKLKNYVPILLLSSGSLYGLDNSQMFKDTLANFVSSGGIIVCLSQQQGYEFQALPGGEKILAYGWRNDQGCFSNSLYIDTWHQALSGQTTNVISAAVDGYFTQYPDSTLVLLRRIKNDEPAMIMYPYGKGWVIATTMYEDWAYGFAQSTYQGRAIIRDIILWAKEHKELPQIKPGESIDLSFELKNKIANELMGGSVNGRKAVKLKTNILDPNRNIINETIQSITLDPEQTFNIFLSFNSSTYPLINSSTGIWSVEYSLFDTSGLEFQKESSGTNFVITQPPSNIQQKADFMLWVTSTTEEVAQGSTAVLTIHIKNNTDTDLINGQIKMTGWNVSYADLLNITVPNKEEVSYTHSTYVLGSALFKFNLYNNEGKNLAYAEKGVWGIFPHTRVNITLDKSKYKRSEIVNITEAISNLTQVPYNCNIQTYILNLLNQKIYDITESINLARKAQINKTYSYTLPPDISFGNYIVCTDIYDTNNKKIGGNSAYFNVPGILVKVTPNLPSTWNSGSNLVSFTLSNIGEVDIGSGELTINMKNLNNIIVYTETKLFANLGIGTSQPFDFNMLLPEPLFGNYILEYITKYNNKIDIGKEVIPCQAVITPIFDKTSYNILDNIQLNVALTNIGKFNQVGQVEVLFNDFGFSKLDSISILSTNTVNLSYTISVPDDIKFGVYQGKIIYTLASGSYIEKNIEITIPDYKLEVNLPQKGSIFSSGSNINIIIKNIGGVLFNGQVEISLKDANLFEIYRAIELLNPLNPGESAVSITIPGEAVSGGYTLEVNCRDPSTNKIAANANTNLQIQGVEVKLNVSTDKESYYTDEIVNANANFNLISGNLQQAKFSYEILGKQGAIRSFPGIGLHDVKSIAIEQNGVIWFGIDGGVVVNYKKSEISGQELEEWRQYTTIDGLASNSVQCILIDNAGNIWCGTHNGLSRFNGTSWRTYTAKDGLSGDDITSIIQDRDGAIWVGTKSGLNRFYGGTWTTSSAFSLEPSAYISDIKEDNFGIIWIATNNGVSSYNNGIWKSYDISNGINSNNVTCVYADTKGNVWIGTWGRGISKFDGIKWNTINNLNELSNLFIRDIIEDKEGNIWIGTERGLNKIEVRSQKAEVRRYFKENGLADDKIKSLGIDASGDLWVGTGKGINIVDSQQSTVDSITYTAIPRKSGPLGHHVYSLLEDSTGVYLGTEMGMSKYDTSGIWVNYTKYDGLPDYKITSIAKDSAGYLWLGTYGGGLAKIDTRQNIVEMVYTQENNGLLSNYITSITIIPKGDIWVGTWNGGVSKFNGTSWSTYTKVNGLGGESVWAIGYETTGILWFGTDEGLTKFDGSIWKIYTIQDGLPINKISSIAIDTTNIKWIGTCGGGIVKFDSNTFTAYTQADGLGSNYIWQVNIDKEGKIWCATNDGGISIFDGSRWEVIDENMGLSDNTIYAISKSGNWAGSFSGLINMRGGLPCKEELKKEITIDITSSSNISTDLGAVSMPGKKYLRARLETQLGQLVREDINSFYCLDKGQSLYLTLDADKESYKPGETINITGKVTNLKAEYLPQVKLVIKIGETDEIVFQDTFPLSASSTYSFNFSITPTNIFTLEAIASASPGVFIFEKIIVEEPKLAAEIIAPEVIGVKPFTATLKLENIGKIDMNISCEFIDISENIALPVGKTALISRQVSDVSSQLQASEFTLTANITGDLKQEIFKKIKFAESVDIDVTSKSEYAEGQIEIPYVLTNTGQVDSEVETEFRVTSDQSQVTSLMNKTHYVPVGQSLSGELQYNLTKGEYVLTCKTHPLINSSTHPLVFDSGTVNFKVLKYNDMEINTSANSNTSDGKINISVNINNIGINDFTGNLLIESPFSRNEENINITKGGTGNYSFSLTPVGLEPGQAEINISILYAGNVLMQKVIKADIYAPAFEFVSIPQYPIYRLGKTETMSFTVKNTGNLQGEAEIKLKILDILDNSQRIWLSSQEQGTLNFEFTIPDDLEAKEYKAIVTLQPLALSLLPSLDIPFKIEGIKIEVTAALDKQSYKVGDEALLTLNITNQDTTYIPQMFARVNYHSYDSSQNFTLQTQPQTLQFSIPVDKFNGEKVFYGIYHKDGRSIHLNTIYLYEQKDIINITTDKQVYKPGEIVFVTIESAQDGHLTITGPSGYSFEGDITIGTITQRFTLGNNLQGGTYSISYQLSANSYQLNGTYNFDVDGIKLKIVECTMDKGKYLPGENFTAKIIVESNYEKDGILQAWIKAPDAKDVQIAEVPTNYSIGQTEVNLTGNIVTQRSGMHRLLYAIYDKQTNEVLAGGAEAFDVGEITIVGVLTDKSDYPNGIENVKILTMIYGTGASGNLEIKLDSTNITNKIISAAGFITDTTIIRAMEITPGLHSVSAYLSAGSLISEKTAAFTYGTSLPDLQVADINIGSTKSDNTKLITASIVKERKLPARNIIVKVETQNFASLQSIGEVIIPELALNGAAAQVTLPLDLSIFSLQPSAFSLKISVDPENTIREYNETNNAASKTFLILSSPVLNNLQEATNNDTTNISGTALAYANIEIYNNGNLAGKTQADSEGKFNYDLALVEGENKILVVAIDSQGNSSIISNTETITLDTISPSPPTGLTVQAGDKQIYLTWMAQIEDTVGYNIYRQFKNQKSKIKINETPVTTTNYLDQNLENYTTYTYWVSAVDKAGNESELSVPIEAMPKPSLTLKVTKEINTKLSRVLVYLDRSPGFDTTVLTDVFNNIKAEYKITETDSVFVDEFRSHKYNTYLIIETGKNPLNPPLAKGEIGGFDKNLIQEEFAESIYSGDGVIIIKTNEKQHRKLFEELTGAKFIGQSKEKNRTIYINSDSTNMQAISTLLRTKIKTGNVIATIDDKDTRQGDCERIELALQYEFTEGAKYFIQIEAEKIDFETTSINSDDRLQISDIRLEQEIDNNKGNKEGNLIIDEIFEDEILFSLNKTEKDLKGKQKFKITITNGNTKNTFEQDINIKESLEEGTEIGDFIIEEIDFEQIENSSNKTFPAIITKTFGNGKAVLFTFEVDKVQEKEKIKNTINNAITYVRPENIEESSLNAIPAHTVIKADNPCELLINEKYDYNLNLINTNGEKTDHTIAWNKNILDTTNPVELKYTIRLPDMNGVYSAETEIKFKAQETWETWSKEILNLTVNASLKENIQKIIDEINRLPIINKKDEKNRTIAIKKLNNIYNLSQKDNNDLQKGIKDLLFCIKTINKISIDTTEIRFKLDKVLRGYEVLISEINP